ncbi:MAG: hypothetical protein EOM03_15230 [Clostridia bacterium]|nr:hypothetical protein [Clostridia bacterium]
MNKSESIAALAAALAKAQGEMENAGKNSVNPHFKSKYADLAEILNTVRPVLSKHGLAVTQFPAFEAGTAHVETILTHASGEWMSGTCSAPVQKSDPQGVGSALTYLRRYSLAAVCGLAQEDDDANSASKPKGQQQRATTPPSAPRPQTQAPHHTRPVMAGRQSIEDLSSYYKEDSAEVMLDDINEMIVKAKPGAPRIDALEELTEAQAQWLIKQIESQLKGAA